MKHTQKICKEAYEAYINSIVATGPENNPKRFWSFVKARRTDHCGVAPLNEDGSVYSDSVAKSNILNKYFNSVYTEELFHNMPTMVENDYPDMPEIVITLQGVVSLLQKLKPFKACGPDQIPNHILKKLPRRLHLYYCYCTSPLSGNQNYLMSGSMLMSHQFLRKVTVLQLVTIDQSH